MNKKQRYNYFVSGSKPTCSKKVEYKDVYEAWDYAEWYYITKEDVTVPYKCPGGNHYHLKSSGIGDMTHIPQDFRDIFRTVEQEPMEPSFFTKLRRWVV